MMNEQALLPQAEYGRLAFDAFVLENWNSSTSPSPTAEEWASLARRYLALTPRQRFPYHQRSYEARNRLSPPDPAVVARAETVLAGHQTAQERNVSAKHAMSAGDCDPVFLRLCYDADLQTAYDSMAEMVPRAPEMLVVKGGEFNDEGLYSASSLEEGVSRFLERVPEVVDGQRYHSDELYAEAEQDQAHQRGEWGGVGDEDVVLMYVVDRQALKEGFVKACFVTPHGELVWWNGIKPNRVLEFRGSWWAMAGILGEFLDVNGGTEKGALLEF